MNKLQEIAYEISGNCPLDETGAQADGYYECKSIDEQIEFIIDTANALETENLKRVSREEAKLVQEYLSYQFDNSNDYYYAFKELGK